MVVLPYNFNNKMSHWKLFSLILKSALCWHVDILIAFVTFNNKQNICRLIYRTVYFSNVTDSTSYI